jgi:hypothetical protein
MIPSKGIPFLPCVKEGCIEKATWGVNWVPTYCDIHKSIGIQPLEENKCKSCKHIRIVNTDSICKQCKLFPPEPLNTMYTLPTHPFFTVNDPSVRSTVSSNDTRTLRSTKSSPNILVKPLELSPTVTPTLALRRCSALSIGSVLTNSSEGSSNSKPASRRSSALGQTLNLKLANLQQDGKLQNSIETAKNKLKAAKALYKEYSSTENSPSKTAAFENIVQLEKEVEDACKAWCKAQRS